MRVKLPSPLAVLVSCGHVEEDDEVGTKLVVQRRNYSMPWIKVEHQFRSHILWFILKDLC